MTADILSGKQPEIAAVLPVLISHRKRFIYFKTIKTAGTSVEVFFERYCLPDDRRHDEEHAITETVTDAGIVGSRMELWKREHRYWSHMPAADIRASVGADLFDAYFKFCVIRNPYDKAVSFFWWIQFKKPERWAQLSAAPFSEVRQAFGAFVASARLPADRHIYTIENRPAVDQFIRYEKMTVDVRAVCSHLGIERPVEEIGAYKSGMRKRPEDYRDYYDSNSEAIVRSAYAWELETLGYSFGD